jgi:hypothetical protein
MSGSSRSRRKRKLEPISIEELAGTTGMSGFCTFLSRDSSVPVPALDTLTERSTGEESSESNQSSAPVYPAPVLTAATRPAPVPDAPIPPALGSSAPVPPARVSDAHIKDAVVSSAPDLWTPGPSLPPQGPKLSAPLSPPPAEAHEPPALEPDAPESSAPDFIWRRRVRIREAVTVQDGHSLAEQAVYDAMYRAGKPYQGDSRILTIGLRTLAELSRMAYSNCKANVRSLVAKLAIDEGQSFSYTDGRTYVIYSFREILRRRKAAGLTHVVRTRGVAFVDPNTGNELSQSSAPDSRAPESPASVPPAPAPTPSAPPPTKTSAPRNVESSALEPRSHIRNRQSLSNTPQSSSADISVIVAALRRYAPDVDDDAAATLWHACLQHAPEATIEELVHFINLKAGRPGIRLPLGFLLTAVPKCFKGDSYRQFRAERQRSRAAQLSRDRMFAEEILKSPDADEEQKQWARDILGTP